MHKRRSNTGFLHNRQTASTVNNVTRHGAIVATLRMENGTGAEKLRSEFEKSFGTTPYEAEFEYEQGTHYYRSQEYASAKKLFERVADSYQSTRWSPWSQYYLGKISEVTTKLEDAAKRYENILKKYPTSDVYSRVLLSLRKYAL